MNYSSFPVVQPTSVREPVRLVIWDLDETFWEGTLTEGGITRYVEANHKLVIALAQRGIISSICSKNDMEPVRKILAEKGLWNYFVFPSINWLPKPERVAKIVEAVQLRPQTVMFIDDNPSNRAAVAAHIPGIQTEPETFIPEIADNTLFKGKNDTGLTRLEQYKLLETRSLEQAKAGDNRQFLRESGIHVEIEIDLEPHYARIVELVNRTNQLNFTKSRFSDVESEAIEELKRQLQPSHEVVAGLVRVRDRYGDYGYCGFYLLRWSKIEHFCFSCRILGFGVESWLYQRLGRPKFKVVGDVLTDLAASETVDWINAKHNAIESEAREDNSAIPNIAIIAHCEGGMIGHYFRLKSSHVAGEGPYQQNGITLVGDSLANLYYRSANRWEASREAFANLGFTNILPYKLLSGSETLRPVIVFSHRDYRGFSYRHKSQDLSLNVIVPDFSGNLISAKQDFLEDLFRRRSADVADFERAMAAISWLRSEFETLPMYSTEMLNLQRRFLHGLCEDAQGGTRILAIMKSPKLRESKAGLIEHEGISMHRALVADTAAIYRNLIPIDIVSCLNSDDQILDSQHYDRLVYYRLSKLIAKTISELSA